MIANIYPMFQDVHVMVFIGFGFLMTFLKRYGLAAVSLNMLMAVLAIEWSLLVHGFLHLHYDICHVDNFSTSDQYSLNQNISSLYHLEESYDQGSDHLENLNNKDIIDEHQLGMEEHLNDTQRQNINCNPSWPWININLHSMIAADFATFAVLVSFGVLLGNNPFTLIILSTN